MIDVAHVARCTRSLECNERARVSGACKQILVLTRRLSGIFMAALCAVMLCLGMPPQARADWSAFDDYPSLTCVEALSIDSYGNVLFDREASTPMPMASITKIMTALVALESNTPLDAVATVSKEAAEITGSVAEYHEGDQVTLLELLKALLIHSGNDSAMVIADLVGGSQEGFVALMNAKATEMGLASTHFANPHGLDAEGHYSCAYDLVQIAKRAWQYPLFRDIVGTSSIVLPIHGVSTTFDSTDALLGSYPGARGVKTGFTYGAGNAFLGCSTRGGVTLFTVILGTASSTARFEATASLLDWSFAHYQTRTLCTSATPAFGRRSLPDRFGWSVAAGLRAPATLRTSPFQERELTYALVHTVDAASSTAGVPLGTVNWYLDGQLVCSRTVDDAAPPQRTTTFGPFMSALFE